MAYKKITGIYLIQSLTQPERVYVGSGVSIKQRWNTHLRLLKNEKHHSPQLQRHYNKYGKDDLVFEIIESGEYINKNHLLSREQGWFDHFKYKNEQKPYFNSAEKAGSRQGVKESEATRQAMRERMIGNQYAKGKHWTLSEETRRKQGAHQMGANNHQFGKHPSLETREKRRLHQLGRKHSEKTLIKMRGKIPWNKGLKGMFKHTDEFRDKMSERVRGENHPLYGTHPSEETSKKRSASLREYWRKKKEKQVSCNTAC